MLFRSWTGDAASYFNQLGHYLKMETATLAQTSGLSGTDQARATAEATVGSTGWTAPAIKDVARLNRALVTGTSLLSQGMDAAMRRPGATRFAPLEFQTRWTQTLGEDGINAIRLYDAVLHKDTEAIQKVATEVAGPGYRGDVTQSEGYLALRKKLEQLNRMIEGK